MNRAMLVSICVVTYNQKDYIEQCLRSIIEQEAEFPFEVIVADDGSTDGTAAMVEDFACRFPDVVVAIKHEKNIGPTQNYLSVHNRAGGVYVAHCDGDDYWLPGKLAFQIGILQQHPEISMVAETSREFGAKRLFNVNDLLQESNPVIHSSKVYRRDQVLTIQADKELLDFFFNVEHARSGLVYLEKARFTVYRENVGTLRTLASQYYYRNCDVASRALELGAERTAAYSAASKARHRLLKNAAYAKNWAQIDELYQPSKIELTLGRSWDMSPLLKYDFIKLGFHLLMRMKRRLMGV